MIVNWNRLLRCLSWRPVFVLATTLMGGVVGLVAVGAVHLFVQPQSRAQFVVSIAGFAAFGFLASVADSAPASVRGWLSNTFASRRLSRREKALWFLAFAVIAVGLFLSVHHAA